MAAPSGALMPPASAPVVDDAGLVTAPWGEFMQELADRFAPLLAREAEIAGLAASPGYASDASAAAAVPPVPIGGFYRNGNVVQVRIT